MLRQDGEIRQGEANLRNSGSSYRASEESKRWNAEGELPKKLGEGLRPAHPLVVAGSIKDNYKWIKNIAAAVCDDRARRGRVEKTNIACAAVDKARKAGHRIEKENVRRKGYSENFGLRICELLAIG